jgi:hypothetical protein
LLNWANIHKRHIGRSIRPFWFLQNAKQISLDL